MSDEKPTIQKFSELGLSEPVLDAVRQVGYEMPSPIQAQTIPPLLDGDDVLGQAQTGTGKTAAFALPLLSRLDIKQTNPQILVLAPTRELAIQVSEAFQRYGSGLRNLRVLPIYGGQAYGTQLNQLRRGVHVVVGTPGRVMDHMKRGTLKLDGVRAMVLDEADEMLRMGFIDDVEWILAQTPENRQTALFSATMPEAIRRIARTQMQSPREITVKKLESSEENIRQRMWMVGGMHKLDALTRLLEAEPFDGMIVFARTRNATVELAEKLEARGFRAMALNGDIAQAQRERIVENLKRNKLDILVATDVAARGLDVDRVSHVINYDIPYDTEAYIHRIGRTGRAGRKGEAILFVTPRERRLLRDIERVTRKKIEPMELPTTSQVNDRRLAKFKQRITDTLTANELDPYRTLVAEYEQEHDVPALEIAAALARLVQGDQPLLLKPGATKTRTATEDRPSKPRKHGPRDQAGEGMEYFRIEVGHDHEVEPRNITGAIANEAGLDGRDIGRIEIRDEYSFVELPTGMPRDIFQLLKKTRVAGQALRITRINEAERPRGPGAKSGKPAKRKKTDSGKPSHSHKRRDKSGTAAGKTARKPRKKNKPAKQTPASE